jgi:hypothetical protein
MHLRQRMGLFCDFKLYWLVFVILRTVWHEPDGEREDDKE